MADLTGWSVLVTGGGSGIGAGVARHFVGRGARVTVAGRSPGPVRRGRSAG